MTESAENDGHVVSRKSRLLLIFTTAIGLLFSINSFLIANRWEQNQIESRFQVDAKEFNARFERSMLSYLDNVSSLKAFYDASAFVDRKAFYRFTQPLLSQTNSIQALEWIPRVSFSEKQHYVSLAKADGFDSFAFTEKTQQNTLVPVQKRDTYYPVLYVEPYQGNKKALGFDLGSNLARRKTLIAARDSGQARATQRITLVQETGQQMGILVVYPVYKKGELPEILQQRRAQLKGFVLSVMRVGNILQSTFANVDRKGFELSLFDRSADEDKQFLGHYSSSEMKVINLENDVPPVLFDTFMSKRLNVGGREWELVTYPSDEFYAINRHYFAWAIMFVVFLLTFWLSAYVYSLLRRSVKAERYTKEILESRTALEYQAKYDALTSLINRAEFDLRLNQALLSVKDKGSSHALLYMDLDRFKVVNDSCGHAVGDRLLKEITQVIRTEVRERDTFARLGGDEFALILEHCDLENAVVIANKIRKKVNDYCFIWEARVFNIGISIGAVTITQNFENIDRIMKSADMACYMAKELGRDQVYARNDDDDDELRQHQGDMDWISRITMGLQNKRLILYQQPILALNNESHNTWTEILVRMIDETGRVLPPGAFLPAAERYQMMPNIDRHVVETVFDFYQYNPDKLTSLDCCFINLSVQTLNDAEFTGFLLNMLEQSNIPCHKVCFEINEQIAVYEPEIVLNFIAIFKDKGCRFSIDNVGSSTCSFNYIQRMPVDFLKIDGAFVRDICSDPIKLTMVKAMNDIGHTMGMLTIANYVENDLILALIKEARLDYAQGYGVNAPVPFVLSAGQFTDSDSSNLDVAS